MRTSFPVENGDTLHTLQLFLQQLLAHGIVDILLVPMRTPSNTVTPALVSDSALLVHADPLAPVFPVNAATLAGQVSVRKPRPKVGVVLRSCELRALVELVKLQQASLDDMLLIAVDCAGAYNVPEYVNPVSGDGGSDRKLWQDLFTAAAASPASSPADLRQACKMCEQPVYEKAQVVIELLEGSLDQKLVVTLPDDVAARLGCTPVEARTSTAR